MYLWRDLKLSVTPSAPLLEDHISNQMSSIEGGITDKTEDHIKRSHQVGLYIMCNFYLYYNFSFFYTLMEHTI